MSYDDYILRGTTPGMLAERFGGSVNEWLNIFKGVTDSSYPEIELAFADRVAEAAGVR